MIKLVNSEQIRNLEKSLVGKISPEWSLTLMEVAGSGLAEIAHEYKELAIGHAFTVILAIKGQIDTELRERLKELYKICRENIKSPDAGVLADALEENGFGS